MKEKNTIKIKRYKSPCGVLLLGSFGEKLCLCVAGGKTLRSCEPTVEADIVCRI